MRLRLLAHRLALVAGLPLALTTCGGASFDDPSQIKGLRVLAVQKNPPYPKAGEDVDVKLLFWDGKNTEDNPRNVHVYFAKKACENPRGDLYLNCFASLASGLVEGTPDGGNPDDMPDGGAPDGDPPDGDVPDGGVPSRAPSMTGFVPMATEGEPRFRSMAPAQFIRAPEAEASPVSADVDHVRGRRFSIPANIVMPRAGSDPYGLVYVLFAVCPGYLGPVPNAGPNTLPLGCFDEADNHLYGADDFVIGYTSMYVFDERANANPITTDFRFDGASIEGSTTDDALVRHVSSCKTSDRTKCQKFPIQVVIDKGSAETDTDPNAKTPDGKNLQEQMWVAFFTTGGDFKSGLRLVNDATRGFNEDNGTEYTAPAEPGTVRLFGVVHDNRGGTAWREGKIIVD